MGSGDEVGTRAGRVYLAWESSSMRAWTRESWEEESSWEGSRRRGTARMVVTREKSKARDIVWVVSIRDCGQDREAETYSACHADMLGDMWIPLGTWPDVTRESRVPGNEQNVKDPPALYGQEPPSLGSCFRLCDG